MDGELGESRVDRNRTLIGVGTRFGWAVLGLESARVSCPCCFLMILGIVLGFSKTAGGFGSGLTLYIVDSSWEPAFEFRFGIFRIF